MSGFQQTVLQPVASTHQALDLNVVQTQSWIFVSTGEQQTQVLLMHIFADSLAF